MNALPYFVTASLFLALFYGCYHVLLRRNTFFGLNRGYLLVTVVLSLVLPMVTVPNEWFIGTAAPDAMRTVTLPAFVIGANRPAESDGLTSDQWFWLVYGLGVLVMLIRLGSNLRAVYRLIGSGTAEQRRGYILVRLSANGSADAVHPSFSFGRYLVLNATDAATEPDALMRHELAHIRQRHTADVLFIEIARAALWFNPVLWLYKRALQEVHEFLADRAASDRATTDRVTTEPTDYAHQLVAYALNVAPTALTTPFVSVSTLKQRIIMLQKPQSRRRALLGYALVLPLAGLLTLCTQPDHDQPKTETEQAQAIIDAANARKPADVKGEIFTVVEQQPEFPGGMKALGEYIGNNLKYPEAAQKANAHGRVFVNFVVTKTGEITDINLLKGIGYGADQEAMRVVAQMPRWKPGSQRGQAVNVRYNLPINFQLDEALDKKESIDRSAFFTPPTDDAEIQRLYKHFIVDGKEVPFDEFKKYSKSAIVEASSSTQTLRLQTVAPPPPPPVPANDGMALDEVKHFTINGKESTKESVMALSPDKIIRVDVNKEQGTVAITAKK